ncbi:hypothetical protein [Streptomyces sp. NPDC090022]|uniref:hypothetical protein n=1 Tax=Streptomyces sp. NPDC090022 TaxID=3365920 RepID=UPI0037F1EAFF
MPTRTVAGLEVLALWFTLAAAARLEGCRLAVPDRSGGHPPGAFGPRGTAGAASVRDFGRTRKVPGRGWAAFEKRPQLALLGTDATAARSPSPPAAGPQGRPGPGPDPFGPPPCASVRPKLGP